MENVSTIVKDFGCVPCGVKIVETFKFENNTKKTQLLEVCHSHRKSESFNEIFLNGKLNIHPTQVELQPKQTVCFKLTYYSHVEDVEDNFSYDIFDSELLVAHLIVHTKTIGPSLHPLTFNVKFLCFRDVNQTVKHIEMNNTIKQEAKFYFDIEEGHRYFEFSQTRGVIPGDLKFGLKISFNPIEPGVYYKRIFCIIQFHKPLIFNLLAVYKPKLKLDPKNLTFKYPRVREYSNSYEAYTHKEEFNKLPEGDKTQPFRKCLESLDSVDIINLTEGDEERPCLPPFPETPVRPECIKRPGEIFLTTSFLDVKNVPEVPEATSIINFSKCQHYYYEWDHDPDDHFQIAPCKGLIKPNTKADFIVYFTPSAADRLYHIEMDVKIFLCNVEPKKQQLNTIELPLMKSLRIIGHSFPENSCGWIPQCRITPKILHLRACVPDERIFGTFTMERDGHLPVTFSVVPAKDPNFTVCPPLGYLSKDFQLLVVGFNSSSKEPGTYAEDLKIKFNNSDMNMETIKVVTSIELPRLIFGVNNKVNFPPVFPRSRVTTVILMTNPTRLHLHYEFLIPECMTWLEIVNPTGSISPKGTDKLKLIFKPDFPFEYLDYVPCHVSSIYKPDYFEEIQLQVMGSCQFGYLVATPSIYDFGKTIYENEKTVEIHLFNFSFILLYFRLKAVNSSFPPGDAGKDVTITPSRGQVPAKGSTKIEVTLRTHNLGYYEYKILCQNFQDNSTTAQSCEAPRGIVLLKFDGVLPYIQIIDMTIYDGGPLFSSHVLWKMLCIDQLNAALRSTKQKKVIKAKIPEAMRNSNPLTLVFLIETHNDKLIWHVNMETQCPCYEASARNLAEDCLHTRAILVRPTKYVSEISKKTILTLKIHYDFTNESSIVMTINSPYKREVILKMSLISLPTEQPTCLSSYFNVNFHLKPVFIGDQQPPLQLFWLYNNTNSPASYSLDMEALRKGSEQKIFDCINPEGVIPEYSSFPLGIIFSPKEMITYMVEVPLELGRQQPLSLRLIGDGVLNVDPLNLIAIQNVLPKSPIIKNGDLECCENYINIPFIGMYSQASQIFFMENTSKTDTWCFKWTSYKFENIFSVAVQPELGLVEPGQKVLMTLLVKTLNHPTTISFSISCEILNNSQVNAYKDWMRVQEIVAERDQQEFTISDKETNQAIRKTESKIPKASKPASRNIFLTVNVNILSDSQMEELLNKNLSYCPKVTKEIYKQFNLDTNSLTPPILQLVQTFLEKLLWDIVFQKRVLERIKCSQKSQDFTYMQMIPQSQKKKELNMLLAASPSTRFVQEILDNTVLEIIFNNFTPKQ